jgi:hypothetical protein
MPHHRKEGSIVHQEKNKKGTNIKNIIKLLLAYINEKLMA